MVVLLMVMLLITVLVTARLYVETFALGTLLTERL